MRQLTVTPQSWPLKHSFTISRGSKTTAEVVHVQITQGDVFGQGECVPYTRYGETVDAVVAQIEEMRDALESGLGMQKLNEKMPPGAARNAVDCALWDLECRLDNRSAWVLAGRKPPSSLITAFTISLDTPAQMAKKAGEARSYSLLKLKLGADDGQDAERLKRVRQACPETRLIVDANEGWSEDQIEGLLKTCAQTQIELVEQPLPEGEDEILSHIKHIVPLCADEAAHTKDQLVALEGKYDWVNIKLDKTGGLTGALEMAKAAREMGFGVMVGCMVGTSLAMAPALLLADNTTILDLDGPLWLMRDHDGGISYKNGHILTPSPLIWGNAAK